MGDGVMDGKGSSIDKPGAAVYLHVPFCASKCYYCDFASYEGQNRLMEPYTNAILSEIASAHAAKGATSVYMGGGTPSMLPADKIAKIMSAVKERFAPAPSAEITIEANPDSTSRADLERYLQIGFNRLSIGVQSFEDSMLEKLGRAHDSKKATAAFEAARKAGFKNVSIDLIYGIPGQSVGDYARDLEAAVLLGPEHISAYQLTVEEETPLWDMVEDGRVVLPDDETMLTMFETTISKLRSAGYGHYEVSNFAKPGMECRHNLAYWLGEEFIGLGSGAHSFVGSSRYANPDDIEDYIYAIDTAGEAGVEILADEKDKVLDFLLMRLRLVDKKLFFKELNDRFFTPATRIKYVGEEGLRFSEGFKSVYSKALEDIAEKKLAIIDDDGFSLTHNGMLFLDDVLLDFEKI
ncbi:MAG: radical SAM family heme chaperone HemW [Nitrospinae bacterium]|nr:radical SAM family heme chaperone HemW [Nitrospinota bacterium]